MKIIKDIYLGSFDCTICGLGFESRSTFAFDKLSKRISNLLVLGYKENTDCFSYQSNKQMFEQRTENIYEIEDEHVVEALTHSISTELFKATNNFLLDITVMSRHRLATVISFLLHRISKGSTLTITYSLSKFIQPPYGITPVKKVCEIADGFSGTLGDLSLPTSIVIGLGYEKGKALGISNYLDSWRDYVLVPESPISEFEEMVRENNRDLLDSIPPQRVLSYSVSSPYSTYVDLKSLVMSLKEYSRPLLIPLGPKILSALCVILSKEFDLTVPVWRVSSQYLEEPIDRPASGLDITFTLMF
ncbi:hypothetical protein TDB9533_03344 [Thalassocella blandensis]|nr:hypothetical protein TDB9533_03344 [Thalassocella blandensis]